MATQTCAFPSSPHTNDTNTKYLEEGFHTSNSGMPPSTQPSALTSRIARSRVSANRTRPYHGTSDRPSVLRKSSILCKFFQSGRCSSSSKCRYQHTLARPDSTAEELDRQLLAFVSDDSAALPNGQLLSKDLGPSSESTPTATEAGGSEHESSDDERLYETISHPETRVIEFRYHSVLHPDCSRTYFVAQRQAVIGYEGNNVGVLSGGVLLGVPTSLRATEPIASDTPEFIEDESETTTGPSLSLSSDASNLGLWDGPVTFDDITEDEHLDWADDDEIMFTPIDRVEPTDLSTASAALPTPPPVIRRIIRNLDAHNRRHSLS